MSARTSTREKKRLEDALRRHGVEGEAAFHLLAREYIARNRRLPRPRLMIEKGEAASERIKNDGGLRALIDSIVSSDPTGEELPAWYQRFIGRRFRGDSGKFFTPRAIARAMAALVPRLDDAVIMDPACGGGTFLVEASKRWAGLNCHLVANDVDSSLVDLAQVVTSLAAPPSHKKSFMTANVYEPDRRLRAWRGRVDYILANPPFSLRLDDAGAKGGLFNLGYRTSDALFLDVCLRLLKPGGRLVCLLPHSIIANAEYSRLRLAVEDSFDLLGVIALPEGVFQMTASTTTRADIVILEKKRAGGAGRSLKAVFACAPSVGVPLNGRSAGRVPDYLSQVVGSSDVIKALGLG